MTSRLRHQLELIRTTGRVAMVGSQRGFPWGRVLSEPCIALELDGDEMEDYDNTAHLRVMTDRVLIELQAQQRKPMSERSFSRTAQYACRLAAEAVAADIADGGTAQDHMQEIINTLYEDREWYRP